MEHFINVHKELCIGCAACVKDCPQSNIEIKEQCAIILDQDCMKCGHCVSICPKNAVEIEGFDLSQIVERNAQPPLERDALLHAIKSRRSIRQFKKKEIDEQVLNYIIEAGRFTPTAKNAQGVSYIIVQNEIQEVEAIAVKLLRKLWPFASLYSKSAKHMTPDAHFFFKQAPVAILVVAKGSFKKVDGSLAASNMAWMAEAQGLGVLYSGFFTIASNMSFALRKKLGLQRKEKVIMTLVLGEPNVNYPRSAPKKPAKVRYL
ncbi:nitroreductase family protein [Amedibacillus sp. YH-ame10]